VRCCGRYILFSYKYDRGDRTQYTLSFINFCPHGCPDKKRMVYARLTAFAFSAFSLNKVLELGKEECWLVVPRPAS
jgi:hypothetical protein